MSHSTAKKLPVSVIFGAAVARTGRLIHPAAFTRNVVLTAETAALPYCRIVGFSTVLLKPGKRRHISR